MAQPSVAEPRAAAPPAGVPSGRRYRRQELWAAALFSVPAVALLGGFLAAPAVYAVYLSFTNRLLLLPQHARFVGLANYLQLLGDPGFWQALGNTFYFVAVVVPVQTVLALGLAVLVNRRIPGIHLFRLAYFSPVVVSMVVVSIVWTLLYNPTSGVINGLLTQLGLPPMDWLHSPRQAMPAIMITSIWQGVGYQMIIFLAGLQDIPVTLYEAAQIDGASRWQQFRHVTLPGLRSVTLFVVVITTIFGFKLFTQPFVMTKGGPQDATRTMIYLLWEKGFRADLIGYSSAIAVVFFVLVLAISLFQNRLGRSA